MHQSSNINREFPVEKSNKINIDQLREIHVHWDDFGSGDAMDVNRMELSIDDEVNSLINNFYIRLGNRLDQQPGSIEDNIMAVIPEGPLRDEMITVTQLTRNDNTPHYMIYGDYFSRIVDRLIPRFSEKLFIGIYKEMRDANTTVLSLPIWQKSLDNTSPYRDVYNNL